MVITLGQQYNVGEKPTVILNCTLTLIAMQGHQQKGRQTNTSSNDKDKSNAIIETSTAQQRTIMMGIFIIQVQYTTDPVDPFCAHLPSQRPVYFFATVPAME